MKMLRWLHRWLGIALGVFIAIVGLSGSWLIYDRELAAPAYAVDPSGAPLPLQALYEEARAHLPANSDISIRFPRSRGLPFQLWAGEQQVVIDQSTGSILAVREAEFWPYGWLFHLHKELLLGKPGENLTGWIGIGVLLILVAGLVLWWPRKWKNAFQLRRSQGRMIFWRDLHKQVGAIAVPFLLLAVITGVSLCFSEWVSSAAKAMFGPGSTPIAVKVATGKNNTPTVTLDELANLANQALPGGRIGIMSVPASAEKPVIVRKQMPGDPHPNGLNFVYLDRMTAEVSKVIPLEEAEPARRWFNWAYPLHTGEALQPWHHWVLLVIGLLPALLFLTGIYLYLLRKGKFRRF